MSPRLIAHLPGWLLIKLGVVDLLTAARREMRAWRRRQETEIRKRWSTRSEEEPTRPSRL
jgi:hypothetical protein